MPEGEIRFGVGATPNWDKFQTLTFSAGASQPGGRGAWNVHKEVSVEEARAFAAEIERWCVIVENDGKPDTSNQDRAIGEALSSMYPRQFPPDRIA